MNRNKTYYIYILASKKNGTLYVGVTNNLERRMDEHKSSLIKGFTSKYKVQNLVHFEEFEDINDAILREKQIKHWNREWKINLIERNNSSWKDLFGNFDCHSREGENPGIN